MGYSAIGVSIEGRGARIFTPSAGDFPHLFFPEPFIDTFGGSDLLEWVWGGFEAQVTVCVERPSQNEGL